MTKCTLSTVYVFSNAAGVSPATTPPCANNSRMHKVKGIHEESFV